MKHLGIITSSALAVAAIARLAVQAPTGGDPILHHPGPAPEVRIAGIYDPRDAVRVSAGPAFVVPPAKVLILTALGGNQGGQASMRIENFWPNGEPEHFNVTTTTTAPIVEFPAPGIVVPSGARVIGGWGYGYLVDAPLPKARPASTTPTPLHVVGIPGDPREFVYFREGGFGIGFEVPTGKRLIITAMGGTVESLAAGLRVNTAPVLYAELPPGQLYYEIPGPGIPVEQGQLVQVLSYSSPLPFTGRAIGYLVDV